MTVTKQVIEDLLPLYEANEASADTRRLVEEYLAAHPEMRTKPGGIELPKIDPPESLERRALEQTQRLLARRNLLLALAFCCNLLPLTVKGSGGRIQFLLYRDLPWVAAAAFVAAGVLWFAFAAVSRRLQDAGLQQSSFGVWFIGGVGASVPLMLAISEWTQQREPLTTAIGIGMVAGCLGIWSGRVRRIWR